MKKKYFTEEEGKEGARIAKKQWELDHKEERAEYHKQYYLDHKEKLQDNHNQNHKKRKLIDPVFKLRRNVSKTIATALKRSEGSKQGESVLQYFPYTIEELKTHLENLFEPWMNWNNYGTYNNKNKYVETDMTTWRWHIDHKEPQSKLLYDSMEHPNFQKCWELSNLQPLEAITNIKKGNK